MGLEALSFVWEEQEAGGWLEGANRVEGHTAACAFRAQRRPLTKNPMARSRWFGPLILFC
ncbi:unnamed protein product [Ectocarpus sp. 8 AP-2014]